MTILERVGVLLIIEKKVETWLRWFGHVKRRPGEIRNMIFGRT